MTAAETTAPDRRPTDLTAQLVRRAGKGRPTPKRNEAQGRRPGPPPPPPTTRKEAYKRHAPAAGRRPRRGRGVPPPAATRPSCPPATAGPSRRLVRDLVDSRRNVGSFFLAVAALALIGTFVPSPPCGATRASCSFGFFLLIIVDSVVLSRKIKRTLAERFPDRPGVKMRALLLVRHQPGDDDPPLALPQARGPARTRG